MKSMTILVIAIAYSGFSQIIKEQHEKIYSHQDPNLPPGTHFPNGRWWLDAPYGTLRAPNGEWYFLGHYPNPKSFQTTLKGPIDEPFKTAVAQTNEETWPITNYWPGFNNEITRKDLIKFYLMNIYIHEDHYSNTYVFGFFHIENYEPCGGPTACDEALYSIGLGISPDYGETWKFVDHIIRPKEQTGCTYPNGEPRGCNIGGAPVFEVNGDLLVYYTEWVKDGSGGHYFYPGVAKASLFKLAMHSSFRTGMSFHKYTNGSWSSENALNSSLPSDNVTNKLMGDTHSDGVYIKSIASYGLCIEDGQLGALNILLSKNGIDWYKEHPITERLDDTSYPEVNLWPYYPTFVGNDDASDDSYSVGRSFNMLYQKFDVNGGSGTTDYYVAQFTVDPLVVPNIMTLLLLN